MRKKATKKRKPKIDKAEKALIKRVYKQVRDGKKQEEIYQQLLFERPQLREKEFYKILEAAYHYLENDLHKDREFVFQLHMGRYEKAYEDLITMERKDGTPLDPKFDWLQIKTRYRAAMAALRSKEDLLGVHDKSIVLEFNQGQIIVGEHVNISGQHIGGINLDKLTHEECKELLGYIQEARTVPIEGVQRITIKKTVLEIKTGSRMDTVQKFDNPHIQDITYEEMPEDVVSKMIDTTIVKLEDEPEPSIIEDDRPKDLPKPKTVDEVGQSHNKILLSQFKNRLNRS